MTDLYLKPQNGINRGCFILVAGGVIALAVAIFVLRALFGGDRDRASTSAETNLSTETAPGIDRQSDTLAQDAAQHDEGPRLLDEARILLEGSQYQAARAKLYAALAASPNPQVQNEARKRLSKLNTEMAFSPRDMLEKATYTIKPGDSLSIVARRFKTTVDLICAGNNIPIEQQHRIQAGKFLRILTGEWHIEVSKRENILDLYLNNRFFKRYRVGTGKFGLTPEGEFEVTLKQKDPPWQGYPPGHPENIIGTRWLAIQSLTDPTLTGYGIHGTTEPETIGFQSSAGCIRLLNEDVEELFMLVPTGTRVVVKP